MRARAPAQARPRGRPRRAAPRRSGSPRRAAAASSSWARASSERPGAQEVAGVVAAQVHDAGAHAHGVRRTGEGLVRSGPASASAAARPCMALRAVRLVGEHRVERRQRRAASPATQARRPSGSVHQVAVLGAHAARGVRAPASCAPRPARGPPCQRPRPALTAHRPARRVRRDRARWRPSHASARASQHQRAGERDHGGLVRRARARAPCDRAAARRPRARVRRGRRPPLAHATG